MKKPYSDPLMFASRSILSSIPLTPSQTGGLTPDDEWGDDDSGAGARSAVFINSAIEAPVAEEPVKIVNPVEEAVEEAATAFTTESAGEAISTTPLEIPSVIEEIVPEATEEAATAATTMP